MTAKEVLDLVGLFLGEPAVTERAEDDPKLIALVGSVVEEIGTEYFPLTACEKFTSTGHISLDSFAQPPLRVLWVHNEAGGPLPFCLGPEGLAAPPGKVLVRYAFAPAKPLAESDELTLAPFVSARAVALGAATDYCLFHSVYEQAAAFDKRYRETLAALAPKRGARVRGEGLLK